MSRPLIISDCDEVLLHMVAPFKNWLEESQGIAFHLEGNNFATAMRWQDSGALLEQKEIWHYLRAFFDTEMDRQMPIAGAVEGIGNLSQKADIVILTNLIDAHRDARAEQLRKVGIDARVFTNQGPKGPALANIIAEYQPSRTIFIDDLAQHHQSASETVPDVISLHLCGEPMIAPHIDCAHRLGHAEARIDTWEHALPWLLNKLEEEIA